MGYAHITNLYADRTMLDLFKKCYAAEKVHGSSSSIIWRDGKVSFFSGGASHLMFIKLFDAEKLKAQFTEEFGVEKPVTIFGEAYGGKMQAMSETYGKDLKFVAFEVLVGEHCFLNMDVAHRVVEKFGLEFVDYCIVDCTVEALDAEKMKDSVQAIRNGCGTGKKREGIVMRPLIELRKNSGERIMAKHKREDFEPERKNTPKISDPAMLEVLKEANVIADEFCTVGRLNHVLSKIFLNDAPIDITRTGEVIKAMVEDVTREAANEIVDSKEVRQAISRKCSALYKEMFKLKSETTETKEQ